MRAIWLLPLLLTACASVNDSREDEVPITQGGAGGQAAGQGGLGGAGAGKTTVMAMLIAWQVINAVRHPTSNRFSKAILILSLIHISEPTRPY